MHFESFYEKLTGEANGVASIIRMFFAFVIELFGKYFNN